ncbi:MAG: LPS-assembly protein LptD [Alphaproteobacteria bacterium]|nr:LPS-assembly protein LptD [Alphaproteobacteria bacterium]
MKSSLFKLLILQFAFCFIWTAPSFAVSEAGEIQRKQEKQPHATMFVTNNMTEIVDVSKSQSSSDEPEEINFSADEMSNDDQNGLTIASGDVDMTYNGMRLKTDKLIYNHNTDTVTALGHVRLYSPDGSVIYGDKVSLSDNLSVGEMHNIKAYLRDQSYVQAQTFRKKSNQTKVLSDALYTACDRCAEKDPLWEVSARKIQHDEEGQNINYNDALLKIKGVPVLYTPFLTHPDPTVKRRSGLMAPSFGNSNYLGTYLQPRYFWAVNDQTNVLFSPIFSSDKGVVLSGAYKQYFYSAYTDISGSYLSTHEDSRPDNRGHLFATGRIDLNEYWRMTYDVKYASDYIYLKEMDLPNRDDAWLTSNVAFERFSGRDYVSAEAYYYKLLSYNLMRDNANRFKTLNQEKPIVAPLIYAEFYSDPSRIGSYFRNEFSTASIYHQNGSETQRLTSINAWELPGTTTFGEKYRFVASVKSDIYYINKYRYNKSDTYTGTTARVFPQFGVEWRLPFVRATDDSRQILEPVVVGVVAPNSKNKVNKIPNDDSEDVYFDDTNVLDLDRYAGYDRNDTGSRLSYGLRWSSYDNIIGRTSAFIAQTFEKDTDSSFNENLDVHDHSHFSDLVGRINAQPNEYLDLNYRFRLDKKTLDAKYSELGVGIGPSFLRGSASYIFLQGNTYYNDLYSKRKELYLALSAELSQYWSVRIYNLQDLTTHNHVSLEHGGSIIYEDECFRWDTSIKKYNTSNPDLEDSYEYTTMFYFKTIGSLGS